MNAIPNEADDRLSAAAPELLEACKTILESIELGNLLATLKNHACKDALISDFKKLIAKAEGDGS